MCYSQTTLYVSLLVVYGYEPFATQTTVVWLLLHVSLSGTYRKFIFTVRTGVVQKSMCYF